MLLRKTTILTLIGLCLATLSFAGTIKGKIRDSKTGEPMTGATVTLEHTHYVTTVQLDGTFTFRHIPAGKYELIASTVGYQSSKEIDVELNSDNDTKEVGVDLSPVSTVLDEVQVTTLGGGSDRGARRLEQRSDMVQNILSARTIEISPDVTVANALARVSGVNIQRDNTGEGRYAIIRGMDQRYNNTLVNGIKIPSPDDKFRFVPMDIFPSDMVERIEVIKALTPGMEPDAIGGTMNLVMKEAPAHFLLTANAAGGYNTIFNDRPFTSFPHSGMNKKSPAELYGNEYYANPNTNFSNSQFNYSNSHPVNSQLGLTIGDRFLDNRLGIILSASYQNFYKGSTRERLVPDAQTVVTTTANNVPSFSDSYIRQYNTQTNRIGLQNKIDYIFNSKNRISLFNMYLRQNDFEERYTPDTTVGLNSSASQSQLSPEYRSTWTIQDIYNATLHGEHQLSGKVKVDWSGVYSIARKQTPDQAWYSFDETITSSAGKVISDDSSVKAGSGTVNHVWQHNKDQDLAGYANISYKPMIIHREVEFTGGGLYRYKTRNNYYNEYALQSDTSATFHTINTVPLAFETSGDAQGITTAINANSYTAHEKVAAGFIHAKFDLLKHLQLLGGVRVENTRQDYTTVMPLTFSGAYGTIHYTDVLPSVHVKYLLADNQNLRLSYFKSISRPGFGEIDPYLLHGEVFDEIGNPNLKHVRADNLDLRYELFPGLADQILVGAFYKYLQDPIEYFVVRNGGPSTLYIQPQNTDHATNFGFEGVFTKFFGILGISANYTYTHSRITTSKLYYEFVAGTGTGTGYQTVAVNETRPLQGQADNIGNLSLLLKAPKLGLDAQLAFSYTGQMISQVSAYYNQDIWQKPFTQLSFSFEKRIVKRLAFFAKVNNLTDSKPRSFMKVPYTVPDATFGGSGYTLPFQKAGSNYTTTQIDIYRINFLAGFRFKF
jgi:hypothetical protein